MSKKSGVNMFHARHACRQLSTYFYGRERESGSEKREGGREKREKREREGEVVLRH